MPRNQDNVPLVAYYPDADAVYIRLRDLPYDHGVDLDTERRVDYAADGQPIGVALLDVMRGGVDLAGLPDLPTMTRVLADRAITVFSTIPGESAR